MESIIINSPCKINFGLNIVSKRSDGFHNIETIFYPINLFDKIQITKSANKKLITNNSLLNSEKDNLILRAISALEEIFNTEFNVEINLEKNIPMGAGLGGGSSNAAATLKAIIKLFNLNIANAELKTTALKLGSDVPFFLNPLPSFAVSRGEELTPINFNISKPILIINPGVHISTKWAYENIVPKAPDFRLSDLNNFDEKDLNSLAGKVKNDFEEKCFSAHPLLKEIKDELYKSGAQFSLMTGSGSTIFGIFQNIGSAKRAEILFKERFFTFINL
jgi:4-diphosphocytidyl-2-C-methyl-D-erythritol kinase